MSENLFSYLQNESLSIFTKVSIDDKENPIGLKNRVISLILLVSAIFSMLFLLIVILIHSKYSKFHRGIYSIIFACIIIEYLYSLIYFIHGLDFLTFGVLQKNDTLCDIISFVSILLITILISFNSFLIINLILNRIPPIIKKKKSINEIHHQDSLLNFKRFSFIRIHLISFLIGICISVYSYLMNNLGRNKTGVCFIKTDSNDNKYLYIILCIVYLILSFSYFFKNICMKKKYSENFPMLKNYWIYLISTSIGWGVNSYGFENSDYDVLNTFVIIGGIMVILVIAFYRFQCGYIKNILKQESSNRFIAMIMILFCLDNKADPDSYERRSTIMIKADYENQNIN
jgi:hypothetical protein